MKNIYYLFLFIFTVNSYPQVNVKGYYRSNGTYVQPHQRTAPNSTITDNYSYPGNYNPNTSSDNSSYSSNYNYTNSTNTKTEWEDGYHRNDGTYVSGYYRTKESNIPTNSSSKKYINTTQVNLRTSPEIGENIINRLNYGDEITSLYNFGDWEKVSVKKYNAYTYNYDTYEGYISSRYLSLYSSKNKVYYPQNNQNNYTNSNLEYYISYKVTVQKAYFHSTPSTYNQNKTYLVYGEIITAIGDSKYFVYIEFTNVNGIKTIGWILKSDIARV